MKAKLSELIKHFFIYGLGSIAQSVTSFILLPIITKHLSAADYGTYVLINMIGLVAGTVFYFGITSALPRSFFDYSEDKDRNTILSTALFLILCGAGIQIISGLILGNKISLYFFHTDNYTQMIQVMLIATAVGFTNTFFQTYFRLLNKSYTVITQGLVASFLNFIVAIVLFNITTLTIYIPIISYFISQLAIFIHSIWLSRKNIQFSFNKIEAKLMLKFGIPTVLVSFTMMAFEWSDRFFLNKYLTLSEVGIYSFAYKFGSLVNPLLIAPFAQIWNPLAMKYKDSEDIKSFTSKVFTLYFVIGSFFCLSACSFLDELIIFFVKNADYHKGIFLIPMIMPAIFIYGSNNISNAGFLYKRKTPEISLICALFAILSVLASYLLIPKFGYIGAALSTLIIYLTLSIALLYRSLFYFSFSIELKKILASITFNFFIIYLNYNIAVPNFFLRIGMKLGFIILSFIASLSLLFGKDTFRIIKKPIIILELIKGRETT